MGLFGFGKKKKKHHHEILTYGESGTITKGFYEGSWGDVIGRKGDKYKVKLEDGKVLWINKKNMVAGVGQYDY